MTASGGIVGQGTGTFDFGALPVTLNAPVYLADTSSASTVKTTGALTLNGASGTALATTPVGGAWHFLGGTIADNGATIAAPAGNVSLEATRGNLTIGSGSTVSAAGVSKQFFDLVQYAPAGAITLTADAGTVDVQAGSTLDFSGAKGGGAAGSLTLSAPKQVVNLNGTIKGRRRAVMRVVRCRSTRAAPPISTPSRRRIERREPRPSRSTRGRVILRCRPATRSPRMRCR